MKRNWRYREYDGVHVVIISSFCFPLFIGMGKESQGEGHEKGLRNEASTRKGEWK